MVSFGTFTPDGTGMPIYLQIILFVKRGIMAGTIRDGDEVPSRRVLSALLGINPNTVQKAYRLLEAEGLMISRAGAKSAICLTPETMARVRLELLGQDARGAVRIFRQMGLTLAEAQAVLETYWDDTPEIEHEEESEND